ncbi:NUDIX hydrolase [Enterococcus gallinarum]|uniref:NUDIX hydrolase n=1 Tax=Enterococcus gallinarum TaxID=1353 RepID=UPI001BD016E2|nr:NUDIX hydrolase [Enterococcus gallinarum]
MDITSHFGVYEVCFKDNKLLCIEKNAGPYRGRFDLPGGSQEIGEGLTETLTREILEETGYSIVRYTNPRIYDVFVKEEKKFFMVHHIMALYDVEIDLTIKKQLLPSLLGDGLNDSDSEVWVELSGINPENSSPLVLKAKQELLGIVNIDKIIYNNWTVNNK